MTDNNLPFPKFDTAADQYLRDNPWAAEGTSDEFPFIGYLDADGNILELDVALDIVDALSDGGTGTTVKLEDLYARVATEDFWQEEIDDQDENTEQPRYQTL